MTAPSWKNANKPSISVNVQQSCQRVHPEKRLCITVKQDDGALLLIIFRNRSCKVFGDQCEP